MNEQAAKQLLQRATLFHGQVTDNLARVYAQAVIPPGATGLSLSGTMTGPTCRHANTLTSTAIFTDAGLGLSLLAEAVLPDPCLWSADLPMMYEAQLEVQQNGRRLAQATLPFGFRSLGTRGTSLYHSAKRIVVRGVSQALFADLKLACWREASAAMYVENPTVAFCQEASLCGVPLICRLDGSAEQIVQQIRDASHWPAVWIIVLDPNVPLDELNPPRTNLIYASLAGEQNHSHLPNWAEVVILELDGSKPPPESVYNGDLPIIVRREIAATDSLEAARRGCDLLQRDMTTHGDFAGYIV